MEVRCGGCEIGLAAVAEQPLLIPNLNNVILTADGRLAMGENKVFRNYPIKPSANMGEYFY
jgi:hypothetical protein